MDIANVLTKEIYAYFDDGLDRLRIYGVKDGKRSEWVIDIRLTTLKEMGGDAACQWVGKSLLLLVPKIRKELFGLDSSPQVPSEPTG